MRFHFTDKNDSSKRISVWFNDIFPEEVELYKKGDNDNIKLELVKDEIGTYFVWEDNKYYMNEFNFIPVEEVYQQESYYAYDLVHTVLREGATNIVIERDVSDTYPKNKKVNMIPCMIEGDTLFPIWKGYKFHLRPIFENDRYNYGDYHTYVDDIASLVFKKIWKIRRATEEETEAIKAQLLINEECKKYDGDDWYCTGREESIRRLGLESKIFRNK